MNHVVLGLAIGWCVSCAAFAFGETTDASAPVERLTLTNSMPLNSDTRVDSDVAPPLSSDSLAVPPLTLVTEVWPPMSYEEDGVPAGFAVDLVKLIEAKLAKKHIIEFYPWARAYAMAQSTPNMLLFSTSMDDKRRQSFSFVGPIAVNRIALYARADDPIEIDSLTQAKEAGVTAVYRHSLGEQLLEDAGFTNLLVSSFPHQSAKQLVRSRVRLWCQADLAVERLLNEVGFAKSDIKQVYIVSQLDLFLAFSKGTSAQTIVQWHQALRQIQASGQMDSLYKQWFGDLPPPEQAEIYWIAE